MQPRIDKDLVARRFGQRVDSYETATPVQEQMADRLMQLTLERLNAPPQRIVELGCGTGRLTRRLRDEFPNAQLTVIDIAPDMVEKTRSDFPAITVTCADAEHYQPQHAADLVISNATVQWFQEPENTIPAWLRHLSPTGIFACSTFTDETFKELQQSFDHAYDKLNLEHQQHVMPLRSIESWQAFLPSSDIVDEYYHPTFSSVRAFLKSIQRAGASNAQSAKPLNRKLYKTMADYYGASFPGKGGITATYHALYLLAKR